MKRFLTLLLVVGIASAMSTTAWAGVSWQTTPILGTDSYDNGDVVVVTDTGLVTIPHYSMNDEPEKSSGAPGVGSSMTMFNIGETVANGSGINVDPGHAYNVVGEYNFLGTSPRSLLSDTSVYTAGTNNFVMNWSHISDPADPVNGGYAAPYYFQPTDVGNWTYTETWTNIADSSDTITSTKEFSVVPEPTTLVVWSLLGLVGAGFGFWRRKK